jgi:type IV pilus assembly protein PilB
MASFDDEKSDKKLEELRQKEEEELVEMLAQSKYGIPYINLLVISIENDALRIVPEQEARTYEVAGFKLIGKELHLAVHSPAKEGLQNILSSIEEKGYHITLYMCSKASLQKAWDRYKEISLATESRAGSLDISGETLITLGEQIKTIEDMTRIVDEVNRESKSHKISRMLEIIMAGAISLGASDVHIEPEESRARLRFRLDGILNDVLFFGLDVYKMLNTRLKLLSGMKLTASQTAQDGRFSIWIKEDEISIRSSMIPGAYGESIVMRILNPKSIRVKLEDLGMQTNLFELIMREIKKPNGMILITGPTGSGKTTTLYAFLQKIYSPDIKIITIEDPVEYHLPGITQTQTETEKGYTFLEGLRSALRQDPDIIMVGEIRDAETAKIAVESALTGHLVFSTLHTNNAAGVIPRLIDLDVNPKIMSSALSLSIAQRLVRKLCSQCKKSRPATSEEKATIEKIIADAKNEGKDLSIYGINENTSMVLFEPVGCENCNKTGFKGRVGVFEAIYNDERISDLIPKNPSEREIKKASEEQHLLDMKEDGVVKILQGVTSLAEVKNVVDFDED